jgi:hypothetical protein
MMCLAANAQGSAVAEAAALRDEGNDFEGRLAKDDILDQDDIEAGLDLVYRIAQHVSTACGAQTPLDRALLLLARPHGADAR